MPKFGRGVEEEVGFALLRIYPFLRMIEDGEYELPIATKMPREKYLMGYVSKKGAQKSDSEFEWKDGGRPSFRLRLRCQSSIFNQVRFSLVDIGAGHDPTIQGITHSDPDSDFDFLIVILTFQAS